MRQRSCIIVSGVAIYRLLRLAPSVLPTLEWDLRLAVRAINVAASFEVNNGDAAEASRLASAIGMLVMPRLDHAAQQVLGGVVADALAARPGPLASVFDRRGAMSAQVEAMAHELELTLPVHGRNGRPHLVQLALLLHELLAQFWGVVVTGAPASGKSTVWLLLLKALQQQGVRGSASQVFRGSLSAITI